MPQVNINIDGVVYKIACEDGQESYLQELAARLSSSIAQLRGSFGDVGGVRLIVMAAIIAIDESVEAERKLANAESRITTLLNERQGIAERIQEVAIRIEELVASMGEAGDLHT